MWRYKGDREDNMPAVKYSHSYDNIVPNENVRPKRTYQTSPAKKSSVKVNKKVKNVAKNKKTALNFALLSLCGVFTIIFIAIYSVVALSETKLTNLHSQIHELNYENIELENKLEKIKSYYSVDTKVASNNVFEKAKNVLELNHLDAKQVYHAKPNNNHLNTITGF